MVPRRMWNIVRYTACACCIYPLLSSEVSRADEYQEAIRKAALATYKYNGWDVRVAELDKRYTPVVIKEYGASVAILVTLAVDKRFVWKWSW